jgi:NAD(P)-dependent dehydrogenase (short-subunit alcohol dehydrogenase family)
MTRAPFGLENQVVLVTGSSRSIGAAIARAFAQQGAKVVVHGRDEAALVAVRADIENAGGRALHVVADLTKLPEIEAMCARIEETFGPIDVLVANAGGNRSRPGQPVDEIPEDAWRACIDDNRIPGRPFRTPSPRPGSSF